jgi:hypothetical protein
MIGLLMKYHQAISWYKYDLGCVTHSAHDLKLILGAKGIRQPSRHHLHSQRNATIIEAKTHPLVEMVIQVLCKFSDWCAQLSHCQKESYLSRFYRS